VKAPELFAIAVALAAPLNVTVAPLPPAAGVIVPDKLKVPGGVGCEFWDTRPEQPPANTSGARSNTNLRVDPTVDLIFWRSISLVRDISVPPIRIFTILRDPTFLRLKLSVT
jgi:hypothetical protein